MQKRKMFMSLVVSLLVLLFSSSLYALSYSDAQPFNIIAKLAVDRNTDDVHEMVAEVAEAIKEEFAVGGCYTLKPICATENMEGADSVEVVHFPAVNIQGSTEYAALVELWSDRDDYFLARYGAEYGINAPWAVSVYTISAPTLQMLSMAHPELNIADNMDQITDYIVVAALNPDAVAKVGYSDLPRFHKRIFSAHCASINTQIAWGV